MFAEVLVEYGVKSLDKTFTYIVPLRFKNRLKIGMKVIVSFGVKKINGFVVNILDSYDDVYNLKEIEEIVDEYLILNKELIEMGKYLQEKTLCSLINAYQTMLPSSLKVKDKKGNYELFDKYVSLNVSEEEVKSYLSKNPRSKKQKEILETLLIEKLVLKKYVNGTSLKILIEKGLVKEKREQKYRIDYGLVEKVVKPVLTKEQEYAIEKIEKCLNSQKTFLIHGVTGSGKTEIYMTLIEKVILENKSAILLVPEISLTTQVVNRFYERFGNLVAIFHSSLSIGEKYDEYLKIFRGEVKVVVGTRSSIFTPMKNLGIIIIDEEHSENYKQENMPRYNTLDMALFRSEYNNIPLVLGSATPSLETMARAKKGIYELIEIKSRIGKSSLPEVILVDMEKEMQKRNMIFSDLLKDDIEARLIKKEQIILLLNRRGFSTFVTCQNCGFTYKCPHCDISLTYHKTANSLRCHYCGYTKYKDLQCPECKVESLNYLGLGTEKLEIEIKKLYPLARVVRMDADTTKNKGSHEKIIKDFQDEKYDILLGTQMISKGLDFPRVSLVGVINADTSLNIPDLRSGERTFQLLSQVSGRAGRGNIPGKVIIQTFNPDNFTLNFVRNNDYENFYKYEMNIRKKLLYPPYYYLISIKVVSKSYEDASLESRKVVNYLKERLDSLSIVLGPTTASMFKVNNMYRFQIMIKYRKDNELFKVLKELDNLYITNKVVNLEIDTSPNRI